MRQQEKQFARIMSKEISLKYLLYTPPDYEETDGKWPLLLFLHGMGERGEHLDMLKKHGPPRLIEEGQDFPFIVVSPQCPADSFWTMELDALRALVAEITEAYRVDLSRLYLTGLSMGGFGSWHLATEYPDLFAAVVPICGGGVRELGYPAKVRALKETPVWAFHGAKDDVVPLEMSQELVEELKSCGGNVRFTVYPEAGHDSWTQTYNNPELYKWLLEQQK